MGDKYLEVIQEAAAEYAAAVAVARKKRDTAAAAGAEVEELEAEYKGIRDQITAFEGGTLLLSAEEFMTMSDRLRWIEVMLRSKRAQYKSFQGEAQLASVAINGAASKARNRLNDLIRAEVEELTARRRAELEAVLRG